MKGIRRKTVIIWVCIIFGIFIIGGILSVVFYGNGSILKAIHLHLNPITVTRGTIKSQVIFPGIIDFDQHVVLQFQQVPSNGVTISWVGVKVGDYVKKRQLLASLDQQTMLKQQQSNLAAYWKQRLTFDQSVADNGGRTPDQALNDTQKRQLQSSQVDLNTSIYTVELQDQISKLTNILTPIDGIVTRVDTPIAGVNIQSADEARFEVINPNTMYFNVDVDEIEVSNLHVGDQGVMVLNAFPTDYVQCTIRSIAFAPHLDANNNTVYTVKLTLNNRDNTKYRYKFGMNGYIVFYEYAENILSIPNDYVHTDDNGSFIHLGTAKKKVYIQTGITNRKIIEVMKGVAEGDSIYY